MSAYPSLSVGTDFLGYRLEELIGQGGMGVVYRATDLRLRRQVALKVMAPELALDELFRKRFARESELAMSLEHPNVVPIYDAGEVDGCLYIAMRHVEGTDLRTLLRAEGALAPERAVVICRQVADALDAAHASGLVHRDVKPSNVLLDARGHAYLADFGLTRQLAEQGADFGSGRSLGTPAYLAPEQIEGGPVDHRADIYSLGCFLFECLTGEAPFARDSRLAVVWAHLEEEPPSASERRPELPEAIDPVLRTAMAKDPEARYATCEALVAAAEDALGLAARATPPRRATLALAAAAVAALAVVGAVIAARDDHVAAASGLAAVRENSVVRIDPSTNEIVAVVDVGRNPVATATGGGRVWVLNERSVSEIDPATNAVEHTTGLATNPNNPASHLGPILAADVNAAWSVGFDYDRVEYRLTKVLRDGRGKQEIRLAHAPVAVALGAGAVWVLAAKDSGVAVVLRIDPATGNVTATTSLPDAAKGADGIAVGANHVWIAVSQRADLYRLDARTARVTGHRDLGALSSLPVVGYGAVWICVANPGSTMLRVDQRTMRDTLAINSIPGDGGRFSPGYGSMWRHDIPNGGVLRFHSRTGKHLATIRVTPKPPQPGGGDLTPTSIAVGAGGVWVPVGRS